MPKPIIHPTKPEELGREGLLWLVQHHTLFTARDLRFARSAELLALSTAASDAWRASLPEAEAARTRHTELLASRRVGPTVQRRRQCLLARDGRSEGGGMKPRSTLRPTLRPLARLTGKDAVWQTIRELAPAEFTGRDIDRRVQAGSDLTRDYLRSLVRAGIVAQLSIPAPGQPARYRLERDCGVEPPRVRADGTMDDAPTHQERLWQAMKVLPSFRVVDLQASTGIASVQTLKSYIAHLHRAGYLAVVEPALATRRTASYRLLPSRNTGPRPPAIRRGRVVFDQNTGRQVWPEVTA
jgi:hypothetical protein